MQALLRQGLDWAYLVQVAFRHGLRPLLYWHLNRLGSTGVPGAILESLREHFLRNARGNLFRTGELLRLLRLFEAHGLRVIPFKGPALAAQAYRSLALREFGDLDLLIQPRDLAAVRNLLVSVGYRPQWPLTDSQEAFDAELRAELVMVRENSPSLVEIHPRFTPRGFDILPDLDALWPRLRPVSVNGTPVRALVGEDLLQVLCVHGAKHLWNRLGWVCDVAELLRIHGTMDWSAVLAQARRFHGMRVLQLGLLLARDLLQAPVPEPLARQAEDDTGVQMLAATVYRGLFQAEDQAPRVLRDTLFRFYLRERIRDGLRYALILALTPNFQDFGFLSLSPSLSFLYPVVRPVRLAWIYGRRFFRRGSAPSGSHPGTEYVKV
jgi:hypothetical protein